MSEAPDHADESFADALARLADEGQGRSPRTAKSLSLNEIRSITVLFQPRDLDHSFLESQGHIKELAGAIPDEPGNVLEPIVVWWSGKHWYVIDGHHRLDAYKLAMKKITLPAIPVRPFEGTLHAAIRESSRLNCRDKMKMTKVEKWERAWKLVCLPEGWTKASIHNATGASMRLVGYMRSKKDELLKDDPEANLLDRSWAEAKRGKPNEVDDEWEVRLAMEFHKKLVKAFGTKLADQPLITARALQLYSPRLVEDMREWWGPSEELEEADF